MNIPITYCPSTNQIRNLTLGYTNTLSDETNQLIDAINEGFETNLYYKEVFKNFDETTAYGAWIYDGKDGDKKVKKFMPRPHYPVQFILGDYISYIDKSGNYQVWMIVSLDQTNEWEVTGTVQQCNYLFKWQNKAGTIISRWGVFEKNGGGDGLNITDVIRTIDSLYTIKLTFDNETKLLREDKRFLIDVEGVDVPGAYKVTERNVMTHNYQENGNLTVLTVIKDPFKPNGEDNKELMIADYFEPTTPTPVGDTNYSVITCSNPDNQVTIGSKNGRTLSVVFYDDKDHINNIITASWSYVKPTGLESLITITPIAGTNNINIKALDDTRLFNKTITATVNDGNGGYQSSIVISFVAG